jgi:hypothetical protein
MMLPINGNSAGVEISKRKNEMANKEFAKHQVIFGIGIMAAGSLLAKLTLA